jgi:16S rRNA (uracil1498-N3)-methyltransferase
MALPFFYSAGLVPGSIEHILDEETSRHIAQVLRMKVGEEINLTNGTGYLFSSRIIEAGKKKVSVEIHEESFEAASSNVRIAISPVKNTSRFEWFLEKATEIGVAHIYPLICNRTEKQHLRHDRMNSILVSAMLQSRQVWLPKLHDNIAFEKFVPVAQGDKFIAHCEDSRSRISIVNGQQYNDPTILIGPEGDFTSAEIAFSIAHGYQPVTLGNTRLRTETAGIVAVTLLNIH